jgi:hypothetical protein
MGMMRTLELICLLPLKPVEFPSNVGFFFEMMQDTATFNSFSVPNVDINQLIFNLDNNTEPYYDNFGELGFESTKIIDNLGTVFDTIFFFPGLLMLNFILSKLTRFKL